MNSIYTDKEDRKMKKRERKREKNEWGEEGRGKQDHGVVRQTAFCLDYHWSLCPFFRPLSLTLFFPSCITPLSILHSISRSYLPLVLFFFHFLCLEITTHTVPAIYAIESLYRPIWGMVVLGHSWHNPLLPSHVRYTRHCAEWMRRSSQCTRTRALSVPGTASKSMCPHNTPPPVIWH